MKPFTGGQGALSSQGAQGVSVPGSLATQTCTVSQEAAGCSFGRVLRAGICASFFYRWAWPI